MYSIYSTNVGTEYFKHALYSPFLSLQNGVCFIMLTCLVPALFTFYIQGVLKLKKKNNNSGAKGLLVLSPFALYRFRLKFCILSHLCHAFYVSCPTHPSLISPSNNNEEHTSLSFSQCHILPSLMIPPFSRQLPVPADTVGHFHTHTKQVKYSDTSANEDNSFRNHIR